MRQHLDNNSDSLWVQQTHHVRYVLTNDQTPSLITSCQTVLASAGTNRSSQISSSLQLEDILILWCKSHSARHDPLEFLLLCSYMSSPRDCTREAAGSKKTPSQKKQKRIFVFTPTAVFRSQDYSACVEMGFHIDLKLTTEALSYWERFTGGNKPSERQPTFRLKPANCPLLTIRRMEV